MGAPLWLIQGTIYLLFNLCHVLLMGQKKNTAFSLLFACLLFHSFLSRFWLFLFPLFPKLFPFLLIIVLLIIASDIFQQWTGIGLAYMHAFFLCFHYFPGEFREWRQWRWNWSFFLMKNFCLLFRENSQRRYFAFGANDVNYGSFLNQDRLLLPGRVISSF